jgi:hypothetical protein
MKSISSLVAGTRSTPSIATSVSYSATISAAVANPTSCSACRNVPPVVARRGPGTALRGNTVPMRSHRARRVHGCGRLRSRRSSRLRGVRLAVSRVCGCEPVRSCRVRLERAVSRARPPLYEANGYEKGPDRSS